MCFFFKERIKFVLKMFYFSVVISTGGLFQGKTILMVVLFVCFGNFTNRIILSQTCFSVCGFIYTRENC